MNSLFSLLGIEGWKPVVTALLLPPVPFLLALLVGARLLLPRRGWGLVGHRAQRDRGRPLKWVEGDSRDTRENAARTVPLLKAGDVRRLLLVTHGWHMPRARRAFDLSAGSAITVEPAPMGLTLGDQSRVLDALPSTHGFARNRQVLREWLGSLAGG